MGLAESRRCTMRQRKTKMTIADMIRVISPPALSSRPSIDRTPQGVQALLVRPPVIGLVGICMALVLTSASQAAFTQTSFVDNAKDFAARFSWNAPAAGEEAG